MKGHWIAYSAEERAWLEANCTMVLGEYHEAFCKQFSRQDVSRDNIKSLRTRSGWKTGRTGCFSKGREPDNKGKKCPPGVGGNHPNARRSQFKKGGEPANTKFLGHERVNVDGYVEISVAETNPHTGYERRYVQKHRWLWEKEHGPVLEGMALKCLGDKLNTDPSNWQLVPRAMLPRLNGKHGRGYDAAPAELKPTIMAVTKLEHGIRESRRNTGQQLTNGQDQEHHP